MKNRLMIPRDPGEEVYWERLLQGTEVPHFLPMEIRRVDNKEVYCYSSEQKMSLCEMGERGDLRSDEISGILQGLADAIKAAQEHLLNPDGIRLHPDQIFFSGEDIRFCYCVAGNGDEERTLSEFLVDHVDHEDERAVKLAYGFDENCRIGIYDPTQLLENDWEELGLYYEAEDMEKQLGLENGTDHEEDESYYFCETADEEAEDHSNLKKILILCIALVLSGSSAYLYLFMNPELLAMIGISQKHYAAAGSVLAAGLLLAILNLMKKV